MEKFNWTVKGGKFTHVAIINGKSVRTKYKRGETFVAPEYEVPNAFRDLVEKGERVFAPEDLKAEIPKVEPKEDPKSVIDEKIPTIEDVKKKVSEKRPYTRRSKEKE